MAANRNDSNEDYRNLALVALVIAVPGFAWGIELMQAAYTDPKVSGALACMTGMSVIVAAAVIILAPFPVLAAIMWPLRFAKSSWHNAGLTIMALTPVVVWIQIAVASENGMPTTALGRLWFELSGSAWLLLGACMLDPARDGPRIEYDEDD